MNLDKLNELITKYLSYEMVLDINVLYLGMEYWIPGQHDSTLTVVVQHQNLM